MSHIIPIPKDSLWNKPSSQVEAKPVETTDVQRARVLAALRRGPVRNIDAVSGQMDGGAPILRLAARIKELREDGCHILTTILKSSNTAAYTLVSEPQQRGAA